MSKIINGDITSIPKEGGIIQQVNCQGAMGAGVALAILKKWPSVPIKYKDLCSRIAPSDLLGNIQAIRLNEHLTLYNSFTQLKFGTHKKQTNEDLLIENIRSTAALLEQNNELLYAPYLIGCGLAGGSWDYVYPRIKDIPNLILVKFK